MFSANHFIWLALCAVLVIVGVVLAVKFSLSMEKALTIMCIVSILSEAAKIFPVLIEGQRLNEYGAFIKESDLPFHLCSLQMFFLAYAKLTKNEKNRESMIRFIIPTASLGATAALLIPTITLSFANVRTYQYFLFHAALIWFAVYALCKTKIKLDFKAFLTTLAGLGLCALLAFYVNGLTQRTNFLYLSEPPMEGLPILNMDNGWLVYFLSYMSLVLVLLLLFFLPFWIYYAVKKKKANH